MLNFLNRAIRSVLWRTGLGRRVAASYWHNRSEGPGFRYLHWQPENIFANVPTQFTDAIFSEYIAKETQHWATQYNFVVEVENVLLEPERLLGIRAGRQLVEQTIVNVYDRQYPYILPYLLRPAKVSELDEAILYDGSATRNYFHHLADALINLQQWSTSGLPLDTPLLVSREIYETVYFQHLYQRSSHFRELNWRIIESKEWVQVKKLYRFHTITFEPSAWKFMRGLYDMPDIKPWRKVFLNRDKQRYGRYLGNEEEIVQMLKRHGFEEVFAENITIEQQAQLFQETEYLVALHGAGLIQQFFMNYAQSHIIEIMPRNYLMPLYYWQAYTLGIRYYDVIVGGEMQSGKAYRVEVATLEAAVVRMLNTSCTGRVYGLTEL
jgi:hypothetical protein